jgi:cellulose synthase/poly-beta-1,6-N-acetylglucosamine synthase-like glycosyltransferase
MAALESEWPGRYAFHEVDEADDFDAVTDIAGGKGISLFAALVLPEVTEWQPVLDRLGISFDDSVTIASRAGANGTTFQAELLVSGLVTETAFYRAVADDLGVPFETRIDPESLLLREADGLSILRGAKGNMWAQMLGGYGNIQLLAAPDLAGWKRLRRYCKGGSGVGRRVKIVAPAVLRQAVLRRLRESLVQRALTHLLDQRPDCSALAVLSAWQAFFLGAFAVAVPTALLLKSTAFFVFLHILFSMFFLGCVALRIAAALRFEPRPSKKLPAAASPEMPVYSVLVALRREAEVVPQLLLALSRLQWPRSKLEIKLVCEEDDRETVHAIRAHPLRSYVEVVVVPVSQPRTKPKALSYALPLTSGEFVVLYDAEDKPHPMQLIEAWQRFSAADAGLGCLQAPLEISNRRASLIANMFGFEYAALFRRLLPWLAAHRLVLPLGGTSNHFRRPVLEEVGGWDPYNVTEDADLGLRLARFGYRAETLSCPTREDGPEDFDTWLAQRKRWFKGWIQTWLVHMRNPVRLARDLPFASFCMAQILFAGMVLSALMHPFLLLSALVLIAQVSGGVPLRVWQWGLLAFDSVTVVLGYASFMVLGRMTLNERESRGFWKVCLLTPVYWLMLSLAAWCSIYELWKRPHHWHKTPHREARRP